MIGQYNGVLSDRAATPQLILHYIGQPTTGECTFCYHKAQTTTRQTLTST